MMACQISKAFLKGFLWVYSPELRLISNTCEFALQEEIQIEKLTTVQSRPLVWSTDIRSTRLYGQFLAGPDPNGHSVSKLARL